MQGLATYSLTHWSVIFFALRAGLKLSFFFAGRPLRNHKCFSNKTARIYLASTSSKVFRVFLKKRSLPCDGASSSKFKAFDVKTHTDWLQTSPVFADRCFNVFNLEKYAARYRTTRGPAPTRCLPTNDLTSRAFSDMR